MQSAGRGSTSPGLELPSVRLADPDRAVLRAGLVGPDRVRLPLAVGAGAAIYVDVRPPNVLTSFGNRSSSSDTQGLVASRCSTRRLRCLGISWRLLSSH